MTRNHEGEIIGRGIIEIMEEKSMTRNHEGEIIGRGIIEIMEENIYICFFLCRSPNKYIPIRPTKVG
jgi:hypothetical protein